MPNTLYLYTTAGCHLCETAKQHIWPLLAEYQLQLREVDIADSDELMARYGVRIPVVSLSPEGPELDWPFTLEQLQIFTTDSLPRPG